MRCRGSLALVCLLAFANLTFAQTPSGQPLPAPTPVPDPGIYNLLRSPSDDAAELATTRDFDTYVYVVNGSDVIHATGMKALACRLRLCGFVHTKFGEWYDMAAFECEYRKVRAEKLNARVVLIGYELGAYMVRAAANRLIKDGFNVDMIGYVGGECLTNNEYTRPADVGRVVNVIGKGILKAAPNLDGAANVRVDALTFSLPCRPETFHALYLPMTRISTTTDVNPAVIMKE
jgi:hypothetical protein